MQTDVLIVGAGLAGLSLADQLQRAGVDFQLIEARNRVGGRILSLPHGSSAFDLGPAWFWPGQSRMAAMAKRFDLTVFEQYASGDLVSEDQRGNVRRGMGFTSMQGSYRIDGGIGQLVSQLAKVLPSERLHLEAKLNALTRQADAVEATVDAPEGLLKIHAGKIVLAIPPRIVEGTIQFSPDLPETVKNTMSSISTWMAGQAKILALYDRPYWREAGLSGDAMSQLGPMVEIHDASPNEGGPFALFGFVGIPAHIRAAHKDEMLQLAKEQLGRLFGTQMLEPEHIFLQDWAEEAFTAVAADLAPAGGHPAYQYPKALKNSWDGALVLGATEVAPQFGGYLEGALEAADNAYELLRS